MSTESTAARLQREFDASFADPPHTRMEGAVDLLVIHIGAEQVALYTDSISAVRVGQQITPVPTPVSSLLGIASTDGQIVAVHDLAKVLRFGSQQEPRWLASVRGEAIAFAFTAFDRHIRVEAASILTTTEQVTTTTHGNLTQDNGVRLAVIDCARLSKQLPTTRT